MAPIEGSEKQAFVEEFGRALESVGLPRTVSRVMAYVAVAPSPGASTNDIVEGLHLSKSSISNATRLLVHLGLLRRVHVPGERQAYYRMDVDAWDRILDQKLEGIRAMREMADEGLELVGEDPDARAGLERISATYGFFEREFPELIERYKRERNGS